MRLLPRTTTLTFATNPTGLKLTFNGVNATAPFSRTVIVGSTNSVSAPSPQQTLRGGQAGVQVMVPRMEFTTPAYPQITAPASGGAYTATFSKK